MNKKRVELFQKALHDLRDLIRQYPNLPPLHSIEKQLEYLIELEEGKRSDGERLSEITLGVITAREVEDLDMKLADTLHQVSSEVRLMEQER